MKPITLAGLAWHAHSPALFTLDGWPVWLAFNGDFWQLAINGAYAERRWNSRDEAALAVATAFDANNLVEAGA